MKVRHDTIFVIRVALIVAGVVPGDWKESWKTKLFKMYAAFLDVQFVTFVLAKFMYTFQDSKYNKELLSFFEGWFESIILLCLTLQRIAFRWKEKQMLELLKQLEIMKPKITTPTLNSYDNLACKISLSFGSLVMMAHFQLVLPFGSFQFLRFILLIAVPLSELFTFCYFGEQLQYHSLMIHRAVYMNNWYRMSKGNQKLLLVVAIRAIRPVRLDVWPHFIPASLDTFLNLCQLSYSAYSVLAGTTTRKIN
ncbi:odorant receptor 23a-like [Homalodisca vitripennis]|uniref:odorant receptor 23a-like n=1 Tax=Homalodisca vitripennis TaxID=197043 RepID=UPI001EEBFC96|nr:odorant receptor 23a-like [Homalodisca vitripennis]